MPLRTTVERSQHVSNSSENTLPIVFLEGAICEFFVTVIAQTEDDPEVDNEKNNVSYEARLLKRLFLKLRDGE